MVTLTPRSDDPSGSSRVPNEIICKILYWFKYLDGDAALPPVTMQEGKSFRTYRNRYTRFALTARRVCRLWRDIVDLRSSYWFRVSTATICLDMLFQLTQDLAGKQAPTAIMYPKVYTDFQAAMSISETSMLAAFITTHTQGRLPFLNMPGHPPLWSPGQLEPWEEEDPEDPLPPDFATPNNPGRTVAPDKQIDIKTFFLDTTQRRFRNRIVEAYVCMPYGTYQDSLWELFDALGPNMIRRFGVGCLDESLETLSILNPQTLAEASGDPNLEWVDRKPLLRRLFPSLDFLCLIAGRPFIPDPQSELPRSVTELLLDSRGGEGITFTELRSILMSMGPQLKSLTACIQPLTETEDTADRPTIRLPSLEKIQVGFGPVTLTNLLHELDCPKLEAAFVKRVWSQASETEPTYTSRRVNTDNPIRLSMLKLLQFGVSGERPILPLEALSLPSLETLYLSERESDILLVPPPLHFRSRLSELRIRYLSLLFRSKEGNILTTFLSLIDTQFLEELHVNEYSDQDTPRGSQFPVLHVPRLRYLEIGGHIYHSPYTEEFILNKLVLNKEFITLKLTNSAHRYPLDLDQTKVNNVTTLIKPRPPETGEREVNPSHDLSLQLYPKVTSLILTECHTKYFKQTLPFPNLGTLVPQSPSQTMAGIQLPVPKLQHLIFEMSRISLQEIHELRRGIMEAVIAVDRRRRAVGAIPLETVTLSLATHDTGTPLEPVVEEFTPEALDGILCRIQLGTEQQQPSYTLQTMGPNPRSEFLYEY